VTVIGGTNGARQERSDGPFPRLGYPTNGLRVVSHHVVDGSRVSQKGDGPELWAVGVD